MHITKRPVTKTVSKKHAIIKHIKISNFYGLLNKFDQKGIFCKNLSTF